jgi:hypothetical protein
MSQAVDKLLYPDLLNKPERSRQRQEDPGARRVPSAAAANPSRAQHLACAERGARDPARAESRHAHRACGAIPNRCMRYCSAVRFIPNRAAAPLGPPSTQFASSSAMGMCARSTLCRVVPPFSSVAVGGRRGLSSSSLRRAWDQAHRARDDGQWIVLRVPRLGSSPNPPPAHSSLSTARRCYWFPMPLRTALARIEAVLARCAVAANAFTASLPEITGPLHRWAADSCGRRAGTSDGSSRCRKLVQPASMFTKEQSIFRTVFPQIDRASY